MLSTGMNMNMNMNMNLFPNSMYIQIYYRSTIRNEYKIKNANLGDQCSIVAVFPLAPNDNE